MGLCYLLAVEKMNGRSSVPEALGKEAPLVRGPISAGLVLL